MTTIVQPTRRRRPYRVPTGLPKPRENWRVGTIASLLLHVAVVFLIITPFAATADIRRIAQGAGGPGPAGGGGGGNRGSGGSPAERLEFVQVAPPPPPAAKVEIPQQPKPLAVEPPKLQAQPQLQPLLQAPLPSPVAMTGTGGIGSDGTVGQGPGRGGGVGTGIGTGRGSAVGPGTGGGDQANYPPTPYEIPLPPMPVPNSIKGDSVIAEFDVDATGRVLSMKFTDTGDRGYNRKLQELLKNFKFRPGTTPDGRPIRMKTQVVYQF